jgi:hypothetical protein
MKQLNEGNYNKGQKDSTKCQEIKRSMGKFIQGMSAVRVLPKAVRLNFFLQMYF